MRRKFLLIHNPIAGPAGRTTLQRVLEALAQRGAEVVPFHRDREPASLVQTAAAGGFEAVLAAGGDGTVRELAKTLAGAPLPIGFVPMGTGNVLAHETGQPRDPAGLADLLMHGPVLHIEGARANAEPFFLMAGVGYDGDVVRRLDVGLKRRLGKLAYAVPSLATLAAPLPSLDIELDGVPFAANWVIVAKARHYGGSFVIVPDADIRREGLHAVLVSARSRMQLLVRLLSLPAGRLAAAPGVRVVACRRAVIQCREPAPVQVDGDAIGTTPLMIEAGGAAIDLIVPAAFVART